MRVVPPTKMRSLSMTSSSECSRLRPSCDRSRCFQRGAHIGYDDWAVPVNFRVNRRRIEECVAQKMVCIQHEGWSIRRIDDDDPLVSGGIQSPQERVIGRTFEPRQHGPLFLGAKSDDAARVVARVKLYCPRFSCARARPRGQRFRSGGAGIKLRGSFVARRSKPLAAGGCGVCAFRHFRLARPCSLSLGVRAPRRRAANEEKQGDC